MTRDELKRNLISLCRSARETGLSASEVSMVLNEAAVEVAMPAPPGSDPITPPTSGGGGPPPEAA